MTALDDKRALLEQGLEVRRQGSELAQERGRLESAVRRAEDARIAAYTAKARGAKGADKQVAASEQELADMRGAMERNEVASTGSRRAHQEIEQELADLKREKLDEFTAEAQRLANVAVGEMLKLRDQHDAAYGAWHAAARAWGDISVSLREAVAQAELAAGVHRSNDWLAAATRVPPWPLPDVLGRVSAGELAPRPPVASSKAGEVTA